MLIPTESVEQSLLPSFVQMKLTRLGENFKNRSLEFQIGLEDWRDGSMLDCEMLEFDLYVLRTRGSDFIEKELRHQVSRYKLLLEGHGVY